ncbi:MAG: FAD-binding oxidoreductase [Chitinophagaceae bacterium]
MANFKTKVLNVKPVTHNVRQFTVEKPANFQFVPGQATDLSVLKDGWENEKRPFTFTSLPDNERLQFTIKIYNDHDGVTHQLGMIKENDAFEISDAWGAIEYKGEGIFIAGGAGVTPFIAIFRYLNKKDEIKSNKLIFSNKTDKDIILFDEFKAMLGSNFINVITDQPDTKFLKGRIDKTFLENNISDFTQHFYVCGPDAFTKDILKALEELNANPEALVFEK